MGKKRALLVGINYPGTSHALKGCVNDVMAMQDVLRNHYGFDDITMLTDAEATTKGILDALEGLIFNAAPGDILYFHYSGHGSQYPNNIGTDEEPDGLDEIICPVDLNWRDKMIRDDDLHRIFDKIPAGVNLTATLDCCNSGSGFDQDNQYQPLGEGKAASGPDPMKGGRFLPPPPEVMALVESRNLTFNRSRALMQPRDLNRTGLLITGCQSHQTSADAYIGGKYMGAATFYLINVLKAHNYDVDYKTVVEEMNTKLSVAGFTQRPELNGSVSLFGYRYLQPMGKEEPAEQPAEDDTISSNQLESNSASDVNEPESNVVVQNTGNGGTGSSTTGDDGSSGGNSKLPLIIGAIAVVALVIFLVTR